jgi:2-desacetyl-2-hydroxyethyl bacteriochlorophyllide A dehydrogenase
MKVMALQCPGVLELETVDRPDPDDVNTVVRVTHSGICGTDLGIYRGTIPVNYPRVMGHEMIGVIVESGEDGPAAGSRVVVDPAYYCGTCYQCQTGQINICPNGGLIGRDRDGGFAEYISVPARNVITLPQEIDDREASFLQVLTTCIHAQELAPVNPGEAIIVIGLGVTGQIHAQLAKESGAGTVIGITRSAWKRELARDLGTDTVLEAGDNLKRRVLDVTDGRGADMVIESAGRVSTFAQSIDLARIGGRILNFGTMTETEGKLPFYDLYYKELLLINARASKGIHYLPSAELVTKGSVKLAPLISHEFPLDELGKALEILELPGGDSLKVILRH